METWIEIFGTLVGRKKRATGLVEWTHEEDKAIRALVAPHTRKVGPRVLYPHTAADGWTTANESQYVSHWTDPAGGVNAAAGEATATPQVSTEQLLSWDPEVVLPLRLRRHHPRRPLRRQEAGGPARRPRTPRPRGLDRLPGLRGFRPAETNYWWWRTPGGDNGVRRSCAIHDAWDHLTERSVRRHYHGLLAPPAGATSVRPVRTRISAGPGVGLPRSFPETPRTAVPVGRRYVGGGRRSGPPGRKGVVRPS
ncbi:hypothetical protein [Streptomyces marokkonensis]